MRASEVRGRTLGTRGSQEVWNAEGLEDCFIFHSTSDTDTDAQILECNIFHPRACRGIFKLTFTVLLRQCSCTQRVFVSLHFNLSISARSHFIPRVHSIPTFLHHILDWFIPVGPFYAHVLLAFSARSPRYPYIATLSSHIVYSTSVQHCLYSNLLLLNTYSVYFFAFYSLVRCIEAFTRTNGCL